MTMHPDVDEMNARVTREYRAGKYVSEEGMPFVLLTVVGRKSGRRMTFPLAVAEDGQDLVIAGSRGGTPVHPQWYLNLVAQPRVTVEYRGSTYDAMAETIEEPAERSRLVAVLTASLPSLPRYEERAAAHRQIPIVALRPL